MIGTANGGNTFPGASLPFGMIQWSPDTGQGWYFHDDKQIHGFSVTHLSGAGCPVFADMPMLPWSDEPTADRRAIPDEAVSFDHAGESAHPGYYAVTLADGTRVELAVTERAGIARLRFAPGKRAGLLLNHAGSASSNVHIDKLPPVGREQDGESLTVRADGSIAGTVTSGGFCGSPTKYTLYVAFETQSQAKRVLLWQDGKQVEGGRAVGKRASAWLDLGDGQEHLLKVGLSYVSEEKARANLRAELPGWDFDAVRAAAEAVWTKALDGIKIDGEPPAERTIFYTALYHNLVAPSVFSDADGAYRGFEEGGSAGKEHQVGAGQKAQYANFSDWDTYRNTSPLQAWLLPDVASDMAQSLVNDAAQMGSLPRWAIANDSSYVMGGDSPSVLLAEYHAFGARRFQTVEALRFIMRGATVPGLGTHKTEERTHLADYMKLGYLPVSANPAAWDDSASESLELASDDFAIGQFAAAVGDRQAAETMTKRAGDWKNLLDPETRWIRPRHEDGRWLEGFDAEKSLPKAGDTPVPTDQRGFQEGNTYQYTFMVPFDYAGLFHAIGSQSVVEARLDQFFKKLVCWGEPCFNMANEPDFVTPYAYTFLGKPAKTADVVTRIEDKTFNTTPGGLAGNDDLGATSGVYVWNALGMYPAIPGMAGVVLGTPRFPKATLRLGASQTLEVERAGSGRYVRAVRLNGKAHPSSWLPLAELKPGRNVMAFTMSTGADSAWATRPENVPPSLTK